MTSRARETVDLTIGSLPKKILLFSLPLIFTNLLQVLFNLSDIAVVGQFSGPVALGAVGSTALLIALYTAFLIGIGWGVNSVVARYRGAGNDRAVSESVHTSALFCLIAGLSVAIFGFFVSPFILRILGTKPELIGGAVTYVRIYSLGMPALALFNFGNAVFGAVGNTRKPLLFLSLSGVVNVLLNLVFVIVFRMDVAGVALASVLSQYLCTALTIASLMRSRGAHRLTLGALRISRGKARPIVGLCLSSGFQNALFAIANLFIQKGVNTFDATFVSGNSAAANADPIVYDVMAAFYTACGSFIGQNYGAGKKERVRKSYFIGLAYSFGSAAFLGLLLVLFGRQFLSLFTGDHRYVIDAVWHRLVIMGCSYAVSAFMDCTIAASRGLGKSLTPTVIVLLGACGFRVAWIYTVFAYFGTVESLYLLYVFSWSLTAVAEIIYFRRVYRECFRSVNS